MKCAVVFSLLCATASAQSTPNALSTECRQLQTTAAAFMQKYNPWRDGPKATIETVKAELGEPQIQPGATAGSFKAVISHDGCSTEVLIDSKGTMWLVTFKTVPVVPSAETAKLDQLRTLLKNITETQQQLRNLETLRDTLVNQSKVSMPAVPFQASPAGASSEDPDSLYLSGKYSEAIAGYTARLSASPDAKSYLRRGHSYHKLGYLPQAIDDYTHSIVLAPDTLAFSNRAAAFLGLGKVDEAIADLDRSQSAQALTPSVTVPASSTGAGTTGGPVSVKGYTRKDGTYVQPHTRSAPRRK